MLADPYATKVLDRIVHGRLVEDLIAYAQDARIQPEAIYTPLANTCSDGEISYVRRFRKHRSTDIAGLCLIGDAAGDVDIERRMSGIAGALVRNFVRARVITMNELFDDVAGDGVSDMSCLLVPNFHVAQKNAKASWKVSNVLDVIVYRRTLGVQTIVYVEDMDAMTQDYGVAVSRILRQHYEHVIL